MHPGGTAPALRPSSSGISTTPSGSTLPRLALVDGIRAAATWITRPAVLRSVVGTRIVYSLVLGARGVVQRSFVGRRRVSAPGRPESAGRRSRRGRLRAGWAWASGSTSITGSRRRAGRLPGLTDGALRCSVDRSRATSGGAMRSRGRRAPRSSGAALVPQAGGGVGPGSGRCARPSRPAARRGRTGGRGRPAISRNGGMSEQKTGRRTRPASSSGMPNPSWALGKISRSAS